MNVVPYNRKISFFLFLCWLIHQSIRFSSHFLIYKFRKIRIARKTIGEKKIKINKN